MFLKQLFLVFLGLSAGGVIAAGVFAFLAIIGVFPRLIGKTHTNKHIFLYETVIIIGGVLGNVSDIYEIPIHMGGNVFLGDLWAGGRNLCRLPRHVSGGDFKGPAGYQQENSSGRGTSVRDPGHRSWQAHRFTRIFHRQFRTVDNRNRR